MPPPASVGTAKCLMKADQPPGPRPCSLTQLQPLLPHPLPTTQLFLHVPSRRAFAGVLPRLPGKLLNPRPLPCRSLSPGGLPWCPRTRAATDRTASGLHVTAGSVGVDGSARCRPPAPSQSVDCAPALSVSGFSSSAQIFLFSPEDGKPKHFIFLNPGVIADGSYFSH